MIVCHCVKKKQTTIQHHWTYVMSCCGHLRTRIPAQKPRARASGRAGRNKEDGGRGCFDPVKVEEEVEEEHPYRMEDHLGFLLSSLANKRGDVIPESRGAWSARRDRCDWQEARWLKAHSAITEAARQWRLSICVSSAFIMKRHQISNRREIVVCNISILVYYVSILYSIYIYKYDDEYMNNLRDVFFF